MKKGGISQWRAILGNPRVDAIRRRFAVQIAFVRARLSPRGYLGLQLTLGALVILGATWLFLAITEDVLTGDPLTDVDVLVANWFGSHSTPALTQATLLISRLHDTIPMVRMVCGLALLVAWKRHWYWFVTFLIVVPGGMLLNTLVKHLIHRPRPDF